MTFDQLEVALGKDRVEAFLRGVEDAFIASRSSGNRKGPAALKQLLAAAIVATTVTPNEHRGSKLRIQRCLRQIQELADATQAEYVNQEEAIASHSA